MDDSGLLDRIAEKVGKIDVLVEAQNASTRIKQRWKEVKNGCNDI